MEQMSKPAFVRQKRWWHPTPVLLPGKSHGWRSLVGCSPWGHWGSDTTKGLHFHFSLSCIGEGNGKPLQCSCLENPRDGGAWGAAIYGVAQSWTQLKWLSTAAAAFVRKWAWLAVNSAKECQWPDSCSPREETEKLSTIIAKMNLMAQKGDQRSPFQKREKWRRIQITVGR